MIFDESLFAHLVNLLERVHFLLELENSIFQHLDVELILAFPTGLPHNIHSHLCPIPFLDLTLAFVALALVVLLNVPGVVMFGPLEGRGVVGCRKMYFG